MSAHRSFYLILTLPLLNTVKCTEVCVFTDEVCMTKSVNLIYKPFIKGIEGQVESSDPLHYDKLKGEVMSLTYKLRNITLTGLINCKVSHLIAYPQNSTYEYFLLCPRLILTTYYEIKGPLASFQLNGKGTLTAISGDCAIELRGEYGTFIDETDQTPRIYLTDVDVQQELKGKLDINYTNLVDGDQEQSALVKKYINENYKQISKTFGKPILAALMTKVKVNYSEYLKRHHIDELVPKLEI